MNHTMTTLPTCVQKIFFGVQECGHSRQMYNIILIYWQGQCVCDALFESASSTGYGTHQRVSYETHPITRKEHAKSCLVSTEGNKIHDITWELTSNGVLLHKVTPK